MLDVNMEFKQGILMVRLKGVLTKETVHLLEKQFGVMVCNIIDLIMTIGILYFLLPILGLAGFLLAIVVSEVFNFSVSCFQLHKTTGFKIPLYLVFCYLSFAIFSIYNIYYENL